MYWNALDWHNPLYKMPSPSSRHNPRCISVHVTFTIFTFLFWYFLMILFVQVDCPGGKKAIVIFVPFPQLKAFQKIQSRLVRELEKKFSGKHVVFIAQRRILKKPTRKANFLKQKRPMSRTLTMVHNAILDDLVFPAEIVGKRIRTRLDGSRLYKENLIYLLFPCNFMFSSNSWTFKFVYINRKNLI